MQEIVIDNTPAVIVVASPISQPKADKAIDISIEDAGDYYTSTNVEWALQEVGATNEQQDISITTLERRGLQEVTDQGATTNNAIEVNNQLVNTEYRTAPIELVFEQPKTFWDLKYGQQSYITITADTDLDVRYDGVAVNPTVPTPSTIILEVIQDATGGHNFTLIGPNFGEIDVSVVITEANSRTLYVLVRCADGKYRGTGKTFLA